MNRRKRPRRSGAITELPPRKILKQMAILQGIFYGAAAPLMLFTALVSGRPFSLGLVLGWDPVRADTTQGWLVAFIWILVGGLCLSIGISTFVGRSKLVLDFALTAHAIHLVVVYLYSGSLPSRLAWWITMAISSAVSVALGTWGCRYRELRPITFGGSGGSGGGNGEGSSRGGNNNGGGSNDTVDNGGDEEQGYSRGRGRGRGRDGGGGYEMLPIKKTDEGGRRD